jgi:predicted alpha/beta-fold hydrolase
MSRAVVLLHDCGGSASASFADTGWLEAIAARGWRAMAPDLPGHGPRTQSHNPEFYRDLAEQLAPDLPVGSMDLVGVALGAKLALELALRHPTRVRRLVLACIEDEEVAVSDTNDPLAISAVRRRPPNPVFTSARLRSIKQPVLVVNANDDPATYKSDALIESLTKMQRHSLQAADRSELTASPEFLTLAMNFLSN